VWVLFLPLPLAFSPAPLSGVGLSAALRTFFYGSTPPFPSWKNYGEQIGFAPFPHPPPFPIFFSKKACSRRFSFTLHPTLGRDHETSPPFHFWDYKAISPPPHIAEGAFLFKPLTKSSGCSPPPPPFFLPDISQPDPSFPFQVQFYENVNFPFPPPVRHQLNGQPLWNHFFSLLPPICI